MSNHFDQAPAPAQVPREPPQSSLRRTGDKPGKRLRRALRRLRRSSKRSDFSAGLPAAIRAARHQGCRPALCRKPQHRQEDDYPQRHRLQRQHELFDLETFSNTDDFTVIACTYQDYCNCARLNYAKGKRPPLDILTEKQTSIAPTIFLLLSACGHAQAGPSVAYGRRPNRRRSPHSQVGHDVPALVMGRAFFIEIGRRG